MAELAAAEEVYPPRTVQAWRALLNWLSFFYHIFVQILRGTPSFAEVVSYLGFRHDSLLSSASTLQFKPLTVVELPETVGEAEEAPLPSPAVPISGSEIEGIDDAPPLEKLTVVLDLDETLVCAYETTSLSAMLHTQATEAGLEWFELECTSSDNTELEVNSKISHVTVFERPGLKEFINQLSEFADLVLFTAGLEGYASPLVDRIDDKRRIRQRLFRQSTISTEYRDHVKDLSSISKNFSRIVLVDNNPFSFLLQPLNGIPCVPFSAGQPHDKQLLEVILPLLKQLSLQEDVRPLLYNKFHMPEWFQRHGIPTHGWTNGA